MIDAILKAGAIILEPIVNIDITAPDRFVGDMTSDISSRAARSPARNPRGGDLMSITGQVPLSEVTEYQSRLRSVTGGQGSYPIEYSHYAMVPPQTQRRSPRSSSWRGKRTSPNPSRFAALRREVAAASPVARAIRAREQVRCRAADAAARHENFAISR